VYLLFLDESGKIDEVGLFALGGIAVRDADWPELRERWQGTLRAAGWPLDREVKWHGIRKGAVPPELADPLFTTLAEAPSPPTLAAPQKLDWADRNLPKTLLSGRSRNPSGPRRTRRRQSDRRG
jgi:hypothetical protein